jgi:hypothetical protein
MSLLLPVFHSSEGIAARSQSLVSLDDEFFVLL